MIDDEGHMLPDPAEIYLPKDFSGIGEHPDVIHSLMDRRNTAFKSHVQKVLNSFKEDHQEEVFADLDKMVAHLARVHNLHQDEIRMLIASWFNHNASFLKIDVFYK